MNEPTFRRPIHWSCGTRSDVGSVRQANEDAALAKPGIGLWAVADGMGGHEVGDVASSMIVEALDLVEPVSHLSDFVDVVEQAVVDVNRQIIDYADMMFDNATMGSTLVALVIRGRVGVCLWAGDSRLYRMRNRHLTQLTRDHSHVQDLLEAGEISAEEAVNHPHGNLITRAVGVEEDGLIDINVFNTQIGDTFLLCSDGLYNTVTDEQIIQMLADGDAEKAAQHLVDASLANGARDNVTVVVIKGEPAKIG